MRLRDDPDALRVLVEKVVQKTTIPRRHIEKDFWLTEALRRMAAVADAERFTLLFKGGTSLSKAFRIIERFSEDVDVLVVLPTASKGAQDRLLRRLIDVVADGCGLAAIPEPSGTTKAVKRAARLHFPTAAASAGTSDGLLIELGSRGGTMPHQRLTIRSLIAEHCDDDLSDIEESAAFDVSVLSPSRTLVEKLVLLHTAHADGDSGRIVKTARHYYDVYQLLGKPDIIEEVAALGIDALARDVVTYSTAAELPASARPAEGFASSPAFTPGSASHQQARDAYHQVIDQFVWRGSPIPSFDSCIARVHTVEATL
jgi:Nucleotidyl transferase AbiEii toxin, Type IV TA system